MPSPLYTSTPITRGRRNVRALYSTGDSDSDQIVVDVPTQFQTTSSAETAGDTFNSPRYTRVERMLDIITKNPEKFKVSDGMILRGGKPIAGSNIVQAVDRILNKGVHNMPSPPGTNILEKIILKDPEAFAVFKQTPPPKFRNTRNRRSIFQTGTGIKVNKKNAPAGLKSISTKFSPKLWS
jgi:hypothetical protein